MRVQIRLALKLSYLFFLIIAPSHVLSATYRLSGQQTNSQNVAPPVVAGIAWSNTGFIAAFTEHSEGSDLCVYDFDPLTFHKIVFQNSATIRDLAVNNKFIYTAHEDGNIVIWEFANRRILERNRFRAHEVAIDSIFVSTDGTLIASSSLTDASVRLWESAGNPLLTLHDMAAFNSSIAIAPDNSRIAIGRMLEASVIYDIGENTYVALEELPHFPEAYIQEIEFVPSRDIIAVSDFTLAVQFWDIEQVKPIDISIGTASNGTAIAFTSEGDQVVTAGSAGDLLFFDIDFENMAATVIFELVMPDQEWARDLDFNPDDDILAVAAQGIHLLSIENAAFFAELRCE